MLAALALAATAVSVMNLTLMTEEVADGAMCIDGSPAAFYFRPGSGADVNHWVIYFEGGGWCYDPADCYYRSTTHDGSSSTYPPQQTLTGTVGGMMSANCSVNPDLCKYNYVYLKYCDGNSFSGNSAEPLIYNNTKLWFRGKRIIDAALNRLVRDFNAGAAEKILLTGCSAGGLATYLHVDYVSAFFSNAAKGLTLFKAAPMSGFFLDHETVYKTEVYEPQMRNIHKLTNATLGGSLNAACVANYLPTGEDWKCNFAQYTYPFIKTPMFILNSGLDAWQTDCIYTGELADGFPNNTHTAGSCGKGSYAACQGAPDVDCNNTQILEMNEYTTDFMAALPLPLPTEHGAFIHSCHTHCEAQHDDWFNNFKVNGVSMQQALALWWHSSDPSAAHTYKPCLRLLGDVEDRQCNPSCGTADAFVYNWN